MTAWFPLIWRGVVLAPPMAVFGALCMLPLVTPGEHLWIYLVLGSMIGAIFALPVTAILIPVLHRRGGRFFLPVAVATALWMAVAPRLTGSIGVFSRPRLDPDGALLVIGTVAALLAAWIFRAWTRHLTAR